MLKVVIFDSGYGGEFFADKLEEEVPVIEVVRVIDWRNASQILSGPRSARKAAEAAPPAPRSSPASTPICAASAPAGRPFFPIDRVFDSWDGAERAKAACQLELCQI